MTLKPDSISYPPRDPLLDEIDDALSKAAREIEALRAERDRLTAEIDYLRASFTKACKTLGEAEAERDRLREALIAARRFIRPLISDDYADDLGEWDGDILGQIDAALAKEAGHERS